MQILFYNRYVFLQITKVLVIWARYWFFFLLLLDLQGKVAIIKSLWIHNSFWIFFFFFNTLLIWLPWRTKIKSVLNKLKVYKKISCSICFLFGCLFLFCYCLVRCWRKPISQRLIWAYNIVMLLWCVLRQKTLLPRSSKLLSIFPGGRSHFFLNSWASLVGFWWKNVHNTG